jgi:hypothetical protein
MRQPWPRYNRQTREEWSRQLESEIRKRLLPVVRLTDRVASYEQAQAAPHRDVIQRAAYIALHFGFGPGGPLPPAEGAARLPWRGYDGSDLDAVTSYLMNVVSEDLLKVKELLDRVIAYEEARSNPRQEIIDQLVYLYHHFALGAGGWVKP